MQWLCSVAGVEHVGYGFDFMGYYDGVSDAIRGLEDIEQAQTIAKWLDGQQMYKKTAFENAVRVLSF